MAYTRKQVANVIVQLVLYVVLLILLTGSTYHGY